MRLSDIKGKEPRQKRLGPVKASPASESGIRDEKTENKMRQKELGQWNENRLGNPVYSSAYRT